MSKVIFLGVILVSMTGCSGLKQLEHSLHILAQDRIGDSVVIDHSVHLYPAGTNAVNSATP